MPFQVKQLKVGPMENFAYVLLDEETDAAAIVDPGFEHQRIVLEAMDHDVTHVLLTHGHHDHVQQAPQAAQATGAAIVAHPDNPVKSDVPVGHGHTFTVGASEVRVLATPGHSPDAVCFVTDRHILTGDTLFVGECGRADLPGSDPHALWRSLLTVLKDLADAEPDLVVLPGHDYGETPTSRLGREFETNYTLKPRDEKEFVEFVLSP